MTNLDNGEWFASIDRITSRPVGQEVEPGHRGQVRMAYRLARSHGEALMFVHGLGWFAWDGARWSEDDQGIAQRAVLDVLRAALTESLDRGDKQLRGDVARCESAAGISGVLEIASALAPFAFTVRHLDADPHLLNVANGTLDVRTFVLRPADPADRITKVCRAAYQPSGASFDAPDGTWSSFIASVLPEDDVRGFVQRLGGLALLGKTVEHVLPIFTGTGANGKGTFYKALLWALGDYADAVEPDLFMHRDGAHPTGEMDLRGLRLAVVSESDRDRKLAEATMKRLTGGDLIKARRMRQDFVTFEPSHLPILITNHLPKVAGDDPAVWRRIRVVPFTVVFGADQQDHGLDDALRLAADDVLAWAVAGYRDYLQHGLAEPEAVRVATSDYQLQSDTLGRFIAERCFLNPHVSATTTELFNDFEVWSMADGADPMSSKAFGRALDQRGHVAIKSTGGKRQRKGIRLRTAAESASDD